MAEHASSLSSRGRYAAFRARHGKTDAGQPDAALKHGTMHGPGIASGAGRGHFIRGRTPAHLREYIGWLWPHRIRVVAVLAISLLAAGLEMAEPLFMRYIIDGILLNDALGAPEQMVRLQLAGTGLLALILVRTFVGVFRDYRQRILNAHVILSLRRSLYERFLHLPLPDLWDMKSGGVLSRLTGDVDTTTGLLQTALVSPALAVIRLAVVVTILFSLNWRLAVTALITIPAALILSLAFARGVRPIYRSLRQDVQSIDGRVGEAISGIRVVRTFARENRELTEYIRGRHTVLRKELFAYRRELAIGMAWGSIIGAGNVAIIWYGGHLNLMGRASIGDIMAFQWYTFLLLSPVSQLVNSLSEIQLSLAAMERVFESLSLEKDKPDKLDALDAPRAVEEITFENVQFEYRQGLTVVRDLSVAVRGGTVVALVGRSGAGKTTVADLVGRFHDPTSGRILLNGTDIRELRLRSYRQLFAVVQQDAFLFDGSVRDNIMYGRADAVDAEVKEAARLANAHHFIKSLPNGYDTFIGERGVKISGGQQQRLAIARAFLAKPEILILDEATSNLDTESEQLIQASMTTLLEGRTAFVIAHRLSTVRRAHLILVMEAGRVIERGSHDDLMRAGGVYRDMVLRQMHSQHHAGEGLFA